MWRFSLLEVVVVVYFSTKLSYNFKLNFLLFFIHCFSFFSFFLSYFFIFFFAFPLVGWHKRWLFNVTRRWWICCSTVASSMLTLFWFHNCSTFEEIVSLSFNNFCFFYCTTNYRNFAIKKEKKLSINFSFHLFAYSNHKIAKKIIHSDLSKMITKRRYKDTTSSEFLQPLSQLQQSFCSPPCFVWRKIARLKIKTKNSEKIRREGKLI